MPDLRCASPLLLFGSVKVGLSFIISCEAEPFWFAPTVFGLLASAVPVPWANPLLLLGNVKAGLSFINNWEAEPFWFTPTVFGLLASVLPVPWALL